MDQFSQFAERMQVAGLPEIFINSFSDYYSQLVSGATGKIPEADILPIHSLPHLDEISDSLKTVGEAALRQTAVIKLNGGLGTSMGLKRAKSLLEIKEGLSFLDIIARQAVLAGIPLILMNSFNTDKDSMAVISPYFPGEQSIPLRFLQHKQPKVAAADFEPVKWSANPELEWCPPGHGDIYTALLTSGTLDILLEKGYQYAFASNADNLGAVFDNRILGYFVENNLQFLMEVADRTEMDRKGGHLTQSREGRLLLRESAQCPTADMEYFQDISRHKYFNTNNLWFHLPSLKEVMVAQDYRLGLPLISNQKTVDPTDPASPLVYQLETAMGSAISVVERGQALRVPRSRFAPVKTTNDLMAVRSDAYSLTEDYRVVPSDSRRLDQFVISLDPNYYKMIADLEERFPKGIPSLIQCRRLEIQGDFRFGEGVVCAGEVVLENRSQRQVQIPDKAKLNDETIINPEADGD